MQIPKRLSKDSEVNKYGRALIGLSKAGDLTIANGRLFSDAGVGDFTRVGTTGRSTVDYVCVSSIDLDSIIDFRVGLLMPESDHKPLECTMR